MVQFLEMSERFGVSKESILSKQWGVLSRLEGFAALSDEQQRLIKLSLYAQERGSRDGSLGAYSQSYDHLYGGIVNCHTAVEALVLNDHTIAFDERRRQGWTHRMINEESETKVFTKIKTVEQLDEFCLNYVEGATLPLVLYIHGKKHHAHTAVILGKIDDDWMVWEKKGYEYPYRLVPLAEQLHDYPDCGWAVDSFQDYLQMVRERSGAQ